MKTISIVFVIALCIYWGAFPYGTQSKYQTSSELSPAALTLVMAPAEAPATFEDISTKVEHLLQQMTLEEKVGQLNQYSGGWDFTGPAPANDVAQQRLTEIRAGLVGSMLNVVTANATREAQKLAVENSRLHIPLIFGYDVIHGYKTIFPIPLAEACSWNPAAIEQSAHISAVEASAAGIHWTFAPMVDVSRDARWGRVMEGSGEDPYLGAQIAAARVRGFQGAKLTDVGSIAACAKHFAGYGFVESGRDYNTVDVSDTTMYNIVLPPFQASMDEGVASFMTAFNEIDSVPATGNVRWLRDWLRGDQRYRGVVVSDHGAIREMVAHGFAAALRDATRLAITASCDIDMESSAYVRELAGLVRSNQVPERLIDDSVRRVLTMKYRLGLFADPYRNCDPERERAVTFTPDHLAASRDIARQCIVLLKNDHDLLPLPKAGGKIAVIGPLAADKDSPLGSWRGQATNNSAVSLLEGIQAAVGEERVLYAPGCRIHGGGQRDFSYSFVVETTDTSGFAEAIAVAKQAEVVVLCVGEDSFQSGEARSRVSITLPGLQSALIREIAAVNPNVVLVVMTGRPVVIVDEVAASRSVLQAWHLGSQAGHAIADVLFGDHPPVGKLTMSFPRATGQVPIYYNHKRTGRPDAPGPGQVWYSHYEDESNDPLFPFGFGLSYTTFKYANLKLSAERIAPGEEIGVFVEVTNTGSRAGVEVVQLYLHDPVASQTRPVKELKAFERVALNPGETKRVAFALGDEQLGFYDSSGEYVVEPGEFRVYIGGNSVEVVAARFARDSIEE